MMFTIGAMPVAHIWTSDSRIKCSAVDSLGVSTRLFIRKTQHTFPLCHRRGWGRSCPQRVRSRRRGAARRRCCRSPPPPWPLRTVRHRSWSRCATLCRRAAFCSHNPAGSPRTLGGGTSCTGCMEWCARHSWHGVAQARCMSAAQCAACLPCTFSPADMGHSHVQHLG